VIEYNILKELWKEMGYLYDFTVYIENKFNKEDITIQIEYYLKDVGEVKKHSIFPGERLGFPLRKKEDYLKLIFDSNNLPDTYYFSGAFWCDVEIKSSNNVELVEKKELVVLDKGNLDFQQKTVEEIRQELKKFKESLHPTYHKWKISSKKDWEMTLSKPDHDPESDNGAVGPDIP
jgi:hypothetical protein